MGTFVSVLVWVIPGWIQLPKSVYASRAVFHSYRLAYYNKLSTPDAGPVAERVSKEEERRGGGLSVPGDAVPLERCLVLGVALLCGMPEADDTFCYQVLGEAEDLAQVKVRGLAVFGAAVADLAPAGAQT